MTASTPFILDIVAFWISLWVGLIAHELGHFATARALGFSIKEVVFGNGWIVHRARWDGIRVEFRLFPTSGFVRIIPMLYGRKLANLIFVSAGVIANVLLIVFAAWAYDTLLDDRIPRGAATAFFFGLSLRLLNVIPGPVKIRGERAATDGLQFLRILRSSGKGVTAASVYLARARRYLPNLPDTAPHSANLPELLWLIEVVQVPAGESPDPKHISRLLVLADGGLLSPAEEILALDCLMTKMLLIQDPALLTKIDDWSTRSLALAPESASLMATRGGVLMELGRYEEARSILASLAWSTDDQFDQLLCRLFLGFTHLKLGELNEAYRCLWHVRRSMGSVYLPYGFTDRLAKIEAELLEATTPFQVVGVAAELVTA